MSSVGEAVLEREAGFEIGQDNVQFFGLDVHNPVSRYRENS